MLSALRGYAQIFVNDLLKQMMLDEKIGQLAQYNDSGYASATSAVQLAANPTPDTGGYDGQSPCRQ